MHENEGVTQPGGYTASVFSRGRPCRLPQVRATASTCT